MKTIKVDLPQEFENIYLYPLSDVHIEDPAHDHKALLKWREEVLESKDRFVLLNGDLVNMATKNSVSDVYSATLTPDEAMSKMVEFLEPIKDRILAVTSGNHDSRAYKESGIDATRRICRELGIEEKYSAEAIVLFISFGKSKGRDIRKQIYSIFMRHGSGGGRKVGAKANSLEDAMGVADCELYIQGHTHQSITFRKSFLRADLRAKKLIPVEKVFLNLNAWLKYEGYGVSHGYHPPSIVHPVVKLHGFSKKIEVKL